VTTSRSLIVAAALLCALCRAAAPARAETTVLALGDSITEGGKTFATYRVPLREKLAAGGYAVRFVGSRTSAAPDGRALLAHEGYGGKTAEYLADNVGRLYKANPADVVLLHAGHNYFAEDKPVERIVAATERIVRTIHSIRPGATVLVAQVIPSGKLPKYAYIPDLNAALPKLVERLKADGVRVVLVDQAVDFDWKTDTIDDKVHPNARGAEKMAGQWYKALAAVLPKPEARRRQNVEHHPPCSRLRERGTGEGLWRESKNGALSRRGCPSPQPSPPSTGERERRP
jgi:lysophospholipase L1-like esterase